MYDRVAAMLTLVMVGGVLNSEAATKKCVTLCVPLSFVFNELREKLLGMVCHFVGDL